MYPYAIMVNLKGERFVDESWDTRGRTYASMGRELLAQPGGVAIQILDAKIREMNLYLPNYRKATTAKARRCGAASWKPNGPNASRATAAAIAVRNVAHRGR